MQRPAGIFSMRACSCLILLFSLSSLVVDLAIAQEASNPSPSVEAMPNTTALPPALAPEPTTDATGPAPQFGPTPAPLPFLAPTPSPMEAPRPSPRLPGSAPAPSPHQPIDEHGSGQKKSSSCSTGCIIGIIVGIAAGVAIILLSILAVCLVRRNRNKRPAIDYSYMVKPQEQQTFSYKSPGQGDYAAAVAYKKRNTKTVCCRLRGVVRTGTIIPNESGTHGHVRVHLGAHETVDLPASEVMQLFAANEQVIYTNPTNGIEKLATIVRSDGTLWPPFYTVKINSDNIRIETVQQQLRASS